MGDSRGENCAGGFGTEHQSVSRLNLLQMLFSTHHAVSELQTNSSAQTKFHYETGAFHILAVALLKHLVLFTACHSISLVLLYPRIFCMPQIFIWGRNLGEALQKFHLQSSTAPQQSGRTQKWASAGDLPDSRGAAEVWESRLVGEWNIPLNKKCPRRLWHIRSGL